MDTLVQASRQRQIRKIMGRVDVSGGTPSVAKGSDYTVVDTAAGEVQVVLTHPGRQTLCIIATPLEATTATGHSVKVISQVDGVSAIFGVYVADATDGALVDDVGFYFEITVKDADN